MAVTAQAMRARRGGISGDLSGVYVLAWTQTHHPTSSVWCIDAEWRACAWTECVQTSVFLNHRAVMRQGPWCAGQAGMIRFSTRRDDLLGLVRPREGSRVTYK